MHTDEIAIAGSVRGPARPLGARPALGPLLVRGMFHGVLGQSCLRPSDASEAVFRSRDGSRLEGVVLKPLGGARGAVVLCHPYSRHGFSYLLRGRLVSALQGAGMYCVLFNFKGFGGSQLRGTNYADDVVGVVEAVKARLPTLPLHLFGLSFGGFHAVSALTQVGDRVDRALLDSVPLRADDYLRGVPGAVTRWLGDSRWAAATGTVPILRSLPEVRATAVQFVYGELDRHCTASQRAALVAAGARVSVLPRLAHLAAFKQQSADYLQRVGAALDAPEVSSYAGF